ncbi:hypothetical protein TPA0908_32490 [Micromonospora sp. AKA38]|nr:hypothetical protein TPA0908_32490 [Micromonospora sp. AKA38]
MPPSPPDPQAASGATNASAAAAAAARPAGRRAAVSGTVVITLPLSSARAGEVTRAPAHGETVEAPALRPTPRAFRAAERARPATKRNITVT